MEEGSEVEANYKQKGEFHKGRITKNGDDGTFDITYIRYDLEPEFGVKESLIRLQIGNFVSNAI